MLSEVVERGLRHPELVLVSLAGLQNLLSSVIAHEPQVLQSEAVQTRLQGLYSRLCEVQSDSARLHATQQDRHVWTAFLSLFIVLHDYLPATAAKVRLYEGLTAAIQHKPWLSEYLQSEEIIRTVFVDTASKVPALQLKALELLRLAMVHQAVCQVYLAKHLLSNLLSKVLTASPSSAHPILEVMQTAAAHTGAIWSLDHDNVERARLQGLLKSEMSAELKLQVALLVKRG
jgi:hypothetical protein